MRKLWIIAALFGAGSVAAQDAGPAGYALLDYSGALVATEVLAPGDTRSAARATLVFPGAGANDMVILLDVALGEGWAPVLTPAQREEVNGRIGIALRNDDGASGMLQISGNDQVLVDLTGDGEAETVSMCLTQTQVHIKAMQYGEEVPLWSRAFTLGYDVSPTCAD